MSYRNVASVASWHGLSVWVLFSTLKFSSTSSSKSPSVVRSVFRPTVVAYHRYRYRHLKQGNSCTHGEKTSKTISDAMIHQYSAMYGATSTCLSYPKVM